MKKQWILVALAFAFAFASCTKTGPVGPNPVEPAVVDPETDTDTTPQAIRFGTNMVSVQTKAGVDAWSAVEPLYIYGYRQGSYGGITYNAAAVDANTSSQTPAVGGYIIRNVMATSPDPNVDANYAVTGPINVVNVNAVDINGDPIANAPFYYTEGTPYQDPNDANYDANRKDYLFTFFGYYVGNAGNYATATPAVAPVPTESENDVTLAVVIDGTQDIMSATADPATDIAGQNILNKAGTAPMSATRAYSSYSSRRGLTPNLIFKHMLSRFKFIVRAGNQEGELVAIESIQLYSKQNGTLTIAPVPALVAANEDPVLVELKDADGDSLPALYLDPMTNKYGWPTKNQFDAGNAYPIRPVYTAAAPYTYTNLGESIMTYPGEATYTMVVNTIQLKDNAYDAQDNPGGYKNDTDTPDVPQFIPLQRFQQNYDIDLSQIDHDGDQTPEGTALSGFQYNVSFVIYGPEEILINVTLSDWDEIVVPEIDPDED